MVLLHGVLNRITSEPMGGIESCLFTRFLSAGLCLYQMVSAGGIVLEMYSYKIKSLIRAYPLLCTDCSSGPEGLEDLSFRKDIAIASPSHIRPVVASYSYECCFCPSQPIPGNHNLEFC